MFNNKAKLFLLFTVMFIAVIGISCVSATDVNDTDTITQHVTTADVPTTSNDDIDNTINNNVQSTSNINSNVNDNANEIKKTVEKQDKNLKELKSNDFSLSLDYAREIPAGSNLSVTYSIGLYETTFAELTLAVAYTNSNGKTVYIRNVYKNSEEESFPNGITDTVNFQNITPVDGAKSYFIHLSFQDMGTGSVETEANEYPFTFNNALPIPPNATVDSINFTTINDKVFVGVDTNVTVVLSNNGAECNRANVILNIDGVNQTKTITNLGSTPKSLVYNYTFANEGVKNVNIIVDYLNGTTSTVYTGTVTVTAPSEEDKSNVTLNSISYTKKQNKVITETTTNVTLTLGNTGNLACNEANVTLTIGDESQTKTITNLAPASTQNLIYNYYFKVPGTKTVSVVVDYLNGTTVEVYNGNVKVEIYYTTVSSEVLTTKASGTVTGGLYHNAIQNPSFDSSLYRKYQSDVTFNFADDYSNITTARLYAVLYDSRDEHPTYSINLTMDGNNDGEYETTIENNHYIGLATTPDSTVYKINDNITKVYTDYVLFYDVTDLINSNTVNVELNSSFGSIKCIGLIVAYNQENTGKEIDYWINLGTVWTNTDVSTTFATRNHDADDVELIQSISSSSNPTTTFNGNTLTYTKSPSGYFGIESWNVTDKYSSSSNMVLKNTASGSFKTMAATLALTSSLPENVVVDSVSFTKTQNAVLAYNDTNVTVVVRNDGVLCDEADVTLMIGDESQTKTVTNIGSAPQSVVFEEFFTSAGLKNVSVVITYSNGTTTTTYSGNVDVIASGYMGKFFTNNTNMTNKVTYDGYNTLNVYGNLFDYKSNQAISFTFDAVANGLTDQDKIVDIFYYQPWGVWNGQVANITVSLNGEELSYMSSYKDQKGFGGYDFPYGLYVYNITDKVSLDETNSFNIAPVSGAAGYAYFYGGYIVAVYENSTSRTLISIAEDCDALSAGTSSSYGATPETAISYANFDGIDTTDVSNAYVTVMANNANTQEYLYMNDNQKALLKDSYNYGSQVAIATADVTEDIAADNVVAIKCVQDTSVYVLTSILVVTYEEPIKQIDMTVVSDCVTKADMATITITFNDTISDGKVEVFIGDEEVPITTITEFDSNVITIENIDTSNYNIGENTITVKYSESNKYEDLTRNAILTLTSRQVSLTAEPLVITKDVNAVNLTITFNDTLSDGIIKIYANNKEIANYNIEDNCNYVDVTINNLKLPLGENDIQIDYSNSQLYENSIINSTITISKLNTVITVDPTKLNTNKSVNLTARINGVNSDAIINEGKVVFKLNGKTLKDENGKVIYVKVVNGVASMIYSLDNISNYNNLNITATYSGSTTFDSSKSDAVTIEKPEVTSPIITMDNMTAKVKDKITINATIKDLEGNNLQNGKVVFKIDGKTVKDSEGKVIYADIINGEVSIEYDTSKLKVGNHTIKVVMISSLFDSRIDQTATLTIEG
jgi:chaperone required for assembly of F1-ATPase